jgi:hypothetical protein
VIDEGGGAEKERSRGSNMPVKGMGDPETEEIVDTDKQRVWRSEKSLRRDLVFKVGKRKHRMMVGMSAWISGKRSSRGDPT